MSDSFLFLQLTRTGANTTVQGEANAAGFENQIELEGFEWGFESPADPEVIPSGQAVSDADLKNRPRSKALKVTKHYDKSSAVLHEALKNGTVFAVATMSLVGVEADDGGLSSNPQRLLSPILTMTFINVRLDSLEAQTEESGNSVKLAESVSMSFETMALVYYPPADFDPSGYAQNVGRRGQARTNSYDFEGPGSVAPQAPQ